MSDTNQNDMPDLIEAQRLRDLPPPISFEDALQLFLAAAQSKVDARFAGSKHQGGKLVAEERPKYIRVVCKDVWDGVVQERSGSAYCFIDRERGQVWKPAGAKGPERKNPRSCIYDADHGASGVTGYGTTYLR